MTGGLTDLQLKNLMEELKWDLSYEAVLTKKRGREQVVVFPTKFWKPVGGKQIQREIEIIKQE